MKILRKKGLKNPRIESILKQEGVNEEKKLHFEILADNAFESRLLTKKLSFFQEQFKVFIIDNIDNIVSKISDIVIKEEGLDRDKDNAKEYIIKALQDSFEIFLEETQDIWEEELKIKLKKDFNFKWKLSGTHGTIETSEEDKKNELLVFCQIPEKANIHHENKVIEAKIINILYKEGFSQIRPNIYYDYISDEKVERLRMNKKIKNCLKNGEVVMQFIQFEENRIKPRIVYLHKSLYSRKKE